MFIAVFQAAPNGRSYPAFVYLCKVNWAIHRNMALGIHCGELAGVQGSLPAFLVRQSRTRKSKLLKTLEHMIQTLRSVFVFVFGDTESFILLPFSTSPVLTRQLHEVKHGKQEIKMKGPVPKFDYILSVSCNLKVSSVIKGLLPQHHKSNVEIAFIFQWQN